MSVRNINVDECYLIREFPSHVLGDQFLGLSYHAGQTSMLLVNLTSVLWLWPLSIIIIPQPLSCHNHLKNSVRHHGHDNAMRPFVIVMVRIIFTSIVLIIIDAMIMVMHNVIVMVINTVMVMITVNRHGNDYGEKILVMNMVMVKILFMVMITAMVIVMAKI